MISGFFRKAAAKLACNGNIQEKYVELYAKTMELMLAMGISLITALLIGYFCGIWWHGVVFLSAFIPLRSYAGGYHAGSYISCYIESCGLFTAALLFLKFFILKKQMTILIILLFLLSSAVIFILAPLADKNKPISEKEEKVFKKRVRMLLGMEMALSVILFLCKVSYGYAVMTAVIVSAFVLALQKWKKM